jgi:hypothetical protein
MMDTPQFQKAEFAGTGGGDRCKLCGQTLAAAYWRVGTNMACEACAEKAKSELPKDSHTAFSRGVLFGIGGAILGLAIYATFTIVTGIILGYVSLAVGYIVGQAIKMGSNGMSGRRYQIAAALLTYAAVSMAAIPIGVSQVVKQEHARQALHSQRTISPSYGSNGNISADGNNTATATPTSPDPTLSPGTDVQRATSALPPANPPPGRTHHKINWGKTIAGLVFVGLASPFLDISQTPAGFIGLFILAIGIRIAWQITGAPITPAVSGPYRNTNVAPAPPASPAPPPRSLG